MDDLNREFPDISRGEADDETGRPRENQYMMRFLREHRFNLSANFHTGYEVVNYPWDWTYDLHVDDAWYRLISREYADEAHSADPRYMMEENEGIVNGAAWYPALGTRQDYVNYYLQGREVTIELSNEKLTDSDSLESMWQKNERSLMYYMTQATYGIHGKVSSAEDGTPLEARVSIPGYDQEYSVVHSKAVHGDFYRFLKAGYYRLVISAEGYLNDTIPNVVVEDYKTTFLDVKLHSPKVGMEILTRGQGFRIWPNPARDELYIGLTSEPHGMVTVELLSIRGQLIKKEELNYTGNTLSTGLDQLEAGYYYLRLSTGDRCRVLSFVKY